MSKRILFVMLGLLLALTGGCSSDGGGKECTDLDGDGYGEGADCAGTDCNDADGQCWTGGCCPSSCTDLDGDGYGVGCNAGTDCNDNDNQCWTGACCPSSCTDLDQDGYGVGCANGADCNDNDPNCWAGACCSATCTDNDGDGYGVGAACTGPDCDDTNNQCWQEGDACCPACIDEDGDGYGIDCPLGLDCNDNDVNCHEGECCPGNCMDIDGDGYGHGDGCAGPDCDDNNNQCWQEGDACCPVYCTDNDGDQYGVGEDCLGPDCNDDDATCHEGACCPTSLNLTGTWAQRFCQNEEYDVPIGDPVQGTRIVVARIELTHTGNVVHETSKACAMIVPQMGLVQVTFPPALINSIPQIETERTLATNSIGDAYDNTDAPLIQLIAWNPTSGNAETEAIPTEANDSRIYDMDDDGKLAATALAVVGKLDCEIYVVARSVIRVSGTVVSPSEISGTALAASDQVTLDASLNLCKLGAVITQMPGSTFTKAKLADPNMTCQQIVANMDSIFGGPCPAFP